MAQPISIGQIIDKTFHLYQKHFTSYVHIGAWLLLSVPLFVASAVATPLLNDPMTNIITVGSMTLANFVLTVVVGLLVGNGLVFATNAYDEGEKDDRKTAYRSAWSRLGAAFVQQVLLGLMVIGAACLVLPGVALIVVASLSENAGVVLPALGMFLLFAGGVTAAIIIAWFIVIFPMARPALLLERRKVVEGIRRAFTLVRGRWWATMLRVLVPKITLGVIFFFLQLVIVFFFFVFNAALTPVSLVIGTVATSTIMTTLQQIAVIAVTAVSLPAFVIADYYVFKDLAATRRTAS